MSEESSELAGQKVAQAQNENPTASSSIRIDASGTPAAVSTNASSSSNSSLESSASAMKNIKYPGMNDVMFGRGGDTNYHIGNHRFRVLCDEFREQYRSSSRREKTVIVQRVVELWRNKTPPGRFLTKTEPDKGDDSLWHDVGKQASEKKAAKILSEKAASKGSKDGAESRKRPPVDTPSSAAQQPAKNPRQEQQMTATPTATSVALAASGATGLALLRNEAALHATLNATATASHVPVNHFQQSQQLIANLTANLNVRELQSLFNFPNGWPAALAATTRAPVDYDFTRLAATANVIAQREIAQRETAAAQNRLFQNMLWNNLLATSGQTQLASSTAPNEHLQALRGLTPQQLENMTSLLAAAEGGTASSTTNPSTSNASAENHSAEPGKKKD